MTRAVTILLSLLMFATIVRADDVQVDSGMHCCFVACRAFGRGPLQYDEFRRAVSNPPSEGYSMAEMVSVIESHGLIAKAVQISLVDLAKLDVPTVTVVDLKDSHFALLKEALNSKTIVALDPSTHNGATVSDWDGRAIIVSDRDFSLPGEAGLSWLAYATIGMLLGAVVLWIFARRGVSRHAR